MTPLSNIWKSTLPGNARRAISTLDEWKLLAPPKSENHWIPGRSAMETAIAWLEGGGALLPTEVSAVLEAHPDFGPTVSWHAEPEAKLHFDDFLGEPRNSDLAVYAEDRHGPYLVAVEAKADEPFGETFADTLAAAVERYVSNQRSKGVARALQLASALFGPHQSGEAKIGTLRYQLMTAVAGALCEAERHGFARTIMLVHEFVTDKTKDVRHARNAVDLASFVTRLSRRPSLRVENGKLLGPFLVPGEPLVSSPISLYVGKVSRCTRGEHGQQSSVVAGQ